MREQITKALTVMLAMWALGCQAKATDKEINAMCKNKLELQGIMRGTSEQEEVVRVKEEYRIKKENLEKEMARDLKGRDDVYAQRLKDIEAGNVVELQPKEEDTEETKEAKGAKKKEEEEEEKTPEQIKEELKQKAKEQMDKGKKEITDQFTRLIDKLGPQGKFAMEKARKYAKKRKKEADAALKNCIDAAKKKAVTQEVALCRTKAKTKADYAACKK